MSEEKTPTLSSKIIKLIHDDNGASDVVRELLDVVKSIRNFERYRFLELLQERYR